MIPPKLISAVVIFVFAVASTGQLPRLVKCVRVAQVQLLMDSKASKWGRAMTLPVQK